ncbi:MAG: hypothetical protein AMS14_05095 [Planctomycetes bacterium DG_20]|nr:MAG: hypothetical protein AMS14_05095 [Planctomycetes bacterium DG_20]
MPIDSYAFGSMVVDGKAHTADLILLPDGVRPDWWREKGHSLSVGDLQDVFAAGPDVLVVGTGAYGVMTVPDATRRALDEAGIETVVEKTGEAAERYNALLAEGRRVAGAFHLTC